MTASRRALIFVVALVAVTLGLPWGDAVSTASAQSISVTEAVPPTGEQGTINLNVLIKGKGFKNGAKAKFYKTGTTDPAGVNVKSTQFVSSTALLATIDIADAAVVAMFDIQVQNTDGRTGKGTELFSVVDKDNGNVSPPPMLPTSVWLDNNPGNMIRAEGDPGSPYVANVVPQLRAGTHNVYDYYLAFWFRYGASGPGNRSIVFDFGEPRFASGDKLQCYPAEDYRQDRTKVPYEVTVPTFLTTGITEGTEEPLWVGIYTGEEWARDADGVWGSLGHYLNLGPYVTGQPVPPAGPRYVDFLIEFRTEEFIGHDVYAYVAYNGPLKTPNSYGGTRGLAEVTPAEGGGFVLRPVSTEGLSGSTLPTAYVYGYGRVPYEQLSGANEANLTVKIPLGAHLGFKAWYGDCNAGTFNMPFVMTVK